MNPKENRLEYARQYQSMSAKERRKVVFPDEKKFNLDGPMAFRSTCTQKIFRKRIIQQSIVDEDLLRSREEPSYLQENLNYNLSAADKKQQSMWRC